MPDGPFSFRIGMVILFPRDAFEQFSKLPGVFAKRFAKIVLLDLIDIGIIELCANDLGFWDHRSVDFIMQGILLWLLLLWIVEVGSDLHCFVGIDDTAGLADRS